MGTVDNRRLLIVGNPNEIHVGAHLLRAAQSLRLPVQMCDVNNAYAASWVVEKYNWWICGHRPASLTQFSIQVIEHCEQFKPQWLLATGICPLAHWALAKIGQLGVRRINYLTDDPWNAAHRAPWFMKSLPLYDQVFSPRKANLVDLQRLGCRKVSFLPFAYAPELHYPEPAINENEKGRFAADIVFVGGADADRIDYLRALVHTGLAVALYGGYWDRYSENRAVWRGHADPPTLRKAITGTKVALCLVRRANRDGHVMRTFEVPAMGTCMLTEDTQEHREIFGEDGQAVVYFRTTSEMVEKLRWLLDHDDERKRLAAAAHALITTGCNTYQDRLLQMIESSEAGLLGGSEAGTLRNQSARRYV